MQRLFLFLLFLSPTFLTAQIVDIPDPNFLAALIEGGVDTNGDGMIQVSEAEVIIGLNIEKEDISDLTGIEEFVNLEVLRCKENSLTDLNLAQNLNLEDLDCSINSLTELNVSENLLIKNLNCSSNSLTTLDVTLNLELEDLRCSLNQLVELNLTNNSALKKLRCSSIPFFNINLTELDVTQNLFLEELYCPYNSITELDVTQNSNLKEFSCSFNMLTDIDVTQNTKLTKFHCDENNLNEIDITQNLMLVEFHCVNSGLSEINVAPNLSLRELNCSFNNLNSLDVIQNVNLEFLDCSRNSFNEIDLTQNLKLNYFRCHVCSLNYLDLSNNPILEHIDLNSTTVPFINIANGFISDWKTDAIFSFQPGLSISNDSLRYVCADEAEADFVRECVGDQVSINTYCNFSLNDGQNCLQGKNQYDINGSCDNTSVSVAQVPFSIQDSTQEYKWWPAYNADNYKMFFPSGSHVIEHCLDFDLFASTPDSLELDFLGVDDTIYQDFCVQPNGPEVTDMAISLIPLDGARAGFESDYKIIIENLGNLFSTGTVVLDFPMDSVQLISSSEAFTINGNQATWNYSDLPILSRQTITFKTRTNSPMDTPAIEGGEILKFRAEVIPDMTDANPIDNSTTLCQTVVNSFDPNDKRCLQGRVLDESQVGSFLDYMIRFENTGSAEAINITVQDTLDTEVYDISTFRLLDASHSVHVSQKENTIEFIFNNIYLSHLDSLNDGYVAFKIKTLDDLQVGDSITNKAAIYFDFNFPIITNEAITIIGIDQDGDGYAAPDDCDDTNSSIFPGATELCDNLDNNCNEAVDEDLEFVTYYLDLDSDGYGDDATARDECSHPDGLIIIGGDCDDTNPDINPDAEDIVNNGIDENCDGEDAVSSIHELEQLGISLYPNPVDQLLYIQQDQLDNLNITMYNLEGKKVLTELFSKSLNTVDVAALTSGVYLVKIQRADEVVNIRVVVR